MKELIDEMSYDLAECHVDYLDDAKLYTDYDTMAQKMVSRGYRKQSEWISVKDRLPESGAHCLLCCELRCIDGTRRPYVCDGFRVERFNIKASGVDDDVVTEYNEEDDEYYLNEGWYEVIKNWEEYSCIVIDDFVTHWMPLPEAPKGGAEV